MNRTAHFTVLGLFAGAVLASPAAGQRLVDDWLVRTGAGPGALQQGPTATFWNPAGTAEQRGRGSLVILELLAPEATGVDVLALSGGWRLSERTTLAAGIQHLGVGGIDYTTTSPDSALRLDVSQDLFAVAAASQVMKGLVVGAGAQYLRSSEWLVCNAAAADDPTSSSYGSDCTGGQLAIGVGARLRAPLPVPVTLAGFAYTIEGGTTWGVAAEVAPNLPLGSWRASANAGVSGGQAVRGTSYRGGVATSWRDVLEVGASLVTEPDASHRQWEPVLSGVVRLSRYELGVVREWLPNSFGTVNTFRFGIVF